MKRLIALAALLLVVGCTGKSVTPPPPAPPPVPEPVVEPAKPTGPAVVKDGAGLRITGAPGLGYVNWAPSGQTALVEGSPNHYRLRLDTQEVLPLEGFSSFQTLGWSGPDDLLLIQWSKAAGVVGELSMRTGEWRPLATAPGQTALCQNGEHWVWVNITEVRQGGAGGREIGTVYRGPKPKGGEGPLAGKPILERGALLGRLADGSCLLDDMNQSLLLLRPDGKLEALAKGFLIPQVTRDGQGVIWREEAGDCPDCIELGSGVPFRKLHWWRLDGKKLMADVGTPQVLTPLLAPDGQRMIIGHGGAISVLGPDGFQRGEPVSPDRTPIGWLDDALLTMSAKDRWTYKAPIYRGAQRPEVGQWLTSGVGGSMLMQTADGVRFLRPDGKQYRLSHQEPFLAAGGGAYGLGGYNPEAPYVAVRVDGGLLLVKLEAE